MQRSRGARQNHRDMCAAPVFLLCTLGAYAQPPGCSAVAVTDRIDCGYGGITESECLERGCCFNRNESHYHECFYPAVQPPSDWAARIEAGSMLFSATPTNSFNSPNIGNGFMATIVGPPCSGNVGDYPGPCGCDYNPLDPSGVKPSSGRRRSSRRRSDRWHPGRAHVHQRHAVREDRLGDVQSHLGGLHGPYYEAL